MLDDWSSSRGSRGTLSNYSLRHMPHVFDVPPGLEWAAPILVAASPLVPNTWTEFGISAADKNVLAPEQIYLAQRTVRCTISSHNCTCSTTRPAPSGNSSCGSTVHPVGGPAVRQAGVFYRVRSGACNPRRENLDILIRPDRLLQRSPSSGRPRSCTIFDPEPNKATKAAKNGRKTEGH